MADVPAATLKNCKKLVITGTGNEVFKIIFAKVSILSDKSLKEFNLNTDVLSEELSLKISQLAPGAKIFIENTKIQNTTDTKMIKNLKTVSLVVK